MTTHEDDEYDEDTDLYEEIHEIVKKLSSEDKDPIRIASYLFSQALSLWKENLEDDASWEILEEIFDRLFAEEENPTIH